MKSLRRLLVPLWLLLLLVSAPLKADQVDDWKAEVTALLPTGTHADKVRQFLRVRKLKFTEAKKEKTISARIPFDRPSGAEKDFVITFQFDDAQLVKSVSYPTPPAATAATAR